MDLEDLLDLGLLFGGFEILESLATIVLALVVVVLLVGAVLLLDFDLASVLVVALLMLGSAGVGGLVGMKVERMRRKSF